MKVKDLELSELLALDPAGGVLRFAGRRAMIMDADALGILRRLLIDNVGHAAARGMLLKFGFAHGWRTAEALKSDFPWDSEVEWRRAGGQIHTLQGFVRIEPDARTGDKDAPFVEGTWHESYEAEQHLAHFGRADESVCWTLTGFASGYLSFGNGTDIVCIEDRCVGKGDAACHVVGRPRSEWGADVEPSLSTCAKLCFESTLEGVVTELKVAEQKLRRRKQALARSGAQDEDPSGLVARSEPMRRTLTLARRVAKVDSTVLITGESGVGKERISRLLHDESTRASGPFVAVNCAAMTETLLESELFGHVKGAFTGAIQDHPGLFEAANGGTLFLDEIGEIAAATQAKLLRVLQERQIRRVGENRSRSVNVRIVAATNRDLHAEVTAGRFRKDLYYRLRVVELRVPPLMERREDVLPLARVLLQQAGERLGRRIEGLSARAADQLLRYDWPGNVRELENAMERAVALAENDRVEMEDLPEEIRMALPGAFGPRQVRTLEEVERDYILAALESNGGHQGRTAVQLGIGTATLYRKLKAYQSLTS